MNRARWVCVVQITAIIINIIPTFWEFVTNLLNHKKTFIAGNSIVSSGRNVSVQAISGTGALRVGAAYLAKWFPGHKQVSTCCIFSKFNRDQLKFETFEQILIQSLQLAQLI